MIVTRTSVFETNSSSSHTVCIQNGSLVERPTNPIEAEFGDFGWGPDTLRRWWNKLSYVVTYIAERTHPKTLDEIKLSCHYKWLVEMVKDFCNQSIELLSNGGYYPFGYIDHQSFPGSLMSIWSDDEETFKENMKELIFNSKYYIDISNDNI